MTTFATSADGTRIACGATGSGPAVIIVDGALCSRGFGPSAKLAEALAPHFTVHTYDRRGRGESGDTRPYAVEREVEDLAALVELAGGRAHLVGVSSGAVLALEAAHRGVPVDKLALYEAPLVVDGTHEPMDPELPARMAALIAADRRGEAVKTFMRWVGTPALVTAVLPIMPPWKKLTAAAPTLSHDIALVSEFQHGEPIPAGRWDGVKAPVLVLAGGKSPEYMRNSQAQLAEVLPDAELRVLPGQTHMVKANVLGPVLVDFLAR
ncbi:alpha/beta fold hydrolase [Saccharothrix coeruleofusca]|uniref:Alpha/beta hydrolase n=1 Tax=Saccharothrix coeruleofusca TaxID=33919 RepID=A0A918EAE0_9PSEU|nr:alpha/beta hydrolase [Saccharothrix coeruleofusca]MBP2340623.1 pimeloyl-ACP methyl ester carboxylesterase [Saccharothrix coeruleofusca]GGP34234.1 alpha/beta hydrolase [Saccharothrix coeruleofusca]